MRSTRSCRVSFLSSSHSIFLKATVVDVSSTCHQRIRAFSMNTASTTDTIEERFTIREYSSRRQIYKHARLKHLSEGSCLARLEVFALHSKLAQSAGMSLRQLKNGCQTNLVSTLKRTTYWVVFILVSSIAIRRSGSVAEYLRLRDVEAVPYHCETQK